MDRTKTIAGVMLLLTLVSCGGKRGDAVPPIRVGSKNFTEQVLLGEIIAQQIERRLHRPVERRLNLGGTLLAHQALSSRQIDLYPEYTGTALSAILKDPVDTDPARVLARVRAGYKPMHVDWLDPLGVDNSFAMVINGAVAREGKFETLSDAAARPWTLGVGYEFEQRADGLPALEKTYGLKWTAKPKNMDLGLLYKALEHGAVDMIAANSTDGVLSKLDLKILADDKHAFPPYQVAIAVRQDAMSETPGLREALSELSGKFTNQQMREMNYQVDALHRPVTVVAAEFLKDHAGAK